MHITQKIKGIILVAACGLCLLGLGVWRYVIVGRTLPLHSAILIDSSASFGNTCQCLRGIISRSLALPRLTSASTLSLLRIGDAATANEPVLLAERPIPVTRKVIEGRQGAEEGRERLLTDLVTTCQALPETDRSPIFQAIRRSSEHLQAKGCSPANPCWLYVITDGEELIEPQLRQALHGTGGLEHLTLPSPIKNEGIHVVFLGLAQTTGIRINSSGKAQPFTPDRSRQPPERAAMIWRKVFTQPQGVTFEPFCVTPPALPGP